MSCTWYEIRLQGRLDPRWTTWLEELDLSQTEDGTTVLRGQVADQAALHGLLHKLRDIGLPLVSVAQVDPPGATAPQINDPTPNPRRTT